MINTTEKAFEDIIEKYLIGKKLIYRGEIPKGFNRRSYGRLELRRRIWEVSGGFLKRRS